MNWTEADVEEISRQVTLRAERIAQLEKMLAHERHVQRIDAVWLVRHTTLSLGDIAALTGSSRVSLDKWLADAGISREEMAERALARIALGLNTDLPNWP